MSKPLSNVQLNPNLSATYDYSDNKLRIYNTGDRLPEEDYKLLSDAGFRWAPMQKFYFATWSPDREDVALAFCGAIEDEQIPYTERAKERVKRYQGYSEGKISEAEVRKQLKADISKIGNILDEADYWKNKAETAQRNLAQKESPDVRHRRIKKLEAELRSHVKTLEQVSFHLDLWSKQNLDDERILKLASNASIVANFPLDKFPRPADKTQLENLSLWKALADEVITPAQAQEIAIKDRSHLVNYYQRWINHLTNRINYEKAMLVQQEGCLVEDKWQHIEVGGLVMVNASARCGHWLTITKVNKRNKKVTSFCIRDPQASGYWAEGKYTVEAITQYQAPQQDSAKEVG